MGRQLKPARYGVSIIPTNHQAKELEISRYHEDFKYKPELESASPRELNNITERHKNSQRLAASVIAAKYIKQEVDVIDRDPINVILAGPHVARKTDNQICDNGIYKWIGQNISENTVRENKSNRKFKKLDPDDWVDDISDMNNKEVGKKVIGAGTPDLILYYMSDKPENSSSCTEEHLPEQVVFAEVKAEQTEGRDREQQSQVEWAWLFQELPRYEIKVDILKLSKPAEFDEYRKHWKGIKDALVNASES